MKSQDNPSLEGKELVEQGSATPPPEASIEAIPLPVEAPNEPEAIAPPNPAPQSLQSTIEPNTESLVQALSKPSVGMHPPFPRSRKRKRRGRNKTKTQSQSPALDSWLGGEGGHPSGVLESGTNPPYKPKLLSKGFCMSDLGDVSGASPEFYNSLVGLIDRRVAAIRAAEGVGMPPVVEELPDRFKAKYEPVVWKGDPEGTIELRITGRPRNERARLVEVDGEVRNVWFPTGYPPMVGVSVACVASDDPDRPGYILVGTYGRKGGRIQ